MKKLIRGLVLRWRLWWVCKKLGIRPYKWQKDYALGKSQYLAGGRRSGKTTAVMLWALIRKVQLPANVRLCSTLDPDTKGHVMKDWWCREYRRVAYKAGLMKYPREYYASRIHRILGILSPSRCKAAPDLPRQNREEGKP